MRKQPNILDICPDCGDPMSHHRMISPTGGRPNSGEYGMRNIVTKKKCAAIYKRNPLTCAISIVLRAEKGKKTIPVGKRRDRRRPARHK